MILGREPGRIRIAGKGDLLSVSDRGKGTLIGGRQHGMHGEVEYVMAYGDFNILPFGAGYPTLDRYAMGLTMDLPGRHGFAIVLPDPMDPAFERRVIVAWVAHDRI